MINSLPQVQNTFKEIVNIINTRHLNIIMYSFLMNHYVIMFMWLAKVKTSLAQKFRS